MDTSSTIGIALDLKATIDLGRIDAVVATISPAVVALAARPACPRDLFQFASIKFTHRVSPYIVMSRLSAQRTDRLPGDADRYDPAPVEVRRASTTSN